MKLKYLTLSAKNQITLNRDIRDALNISAGDKVYFENTSKGLVLKKLENIENCPICDNGVFCNEKCLICDGEGIIKNKVYKEYILGKLLNVLLVNKVTDIDVRKNDRFGYIVNTKSDNEVVSSYIKKCQGYIVKLHLKEYVAKGELISTELKESCIETFKNILDEDDLLLIINSVQLDSIKDMLKQKITITKEEYDMYINAFDSAYKDKVAHFLMPFAKL